ncbi:TcpE family conjugal transfer membrane protein [Enterococcus sp. DIV2324]|uniref:TcpE family conjugal transfer membrane protein n=1 Tax=Enterococcus sp. DIV2324 TaxID=2774763 RepID=UPI003F2323D5
MSLTKDQRKTVTYTSLMTAPVAIRISIPTMKTGKNKITLPWLINFRSIAIYVVCFFLIRNLFGSIIQFAGTLLSLADIALSAVLPYLLMRFVLKINTDGKPIERYLLDTVFFFFKVILPNKEVYKGNYQKKQKDTVVYVSKKGGIL